MRNHLFPLGKEKEAFEYLPKILMKTNGHSSTSSSATKRKLEKSKVADSEEQINKKMKIENEAQDDS